MRTLNRQKQDTPLIIATKNVNINIVKLLVDNGAHINKEDGYGNTALDWAKIRENDAIFKLLSAKHENFLFWQYFLSGCKKVLISPLLLTLRLIPEWHF